MPYFPLGSAFPGFPKVTDQPEVVRAAEELGVTPSQVGLAWLLGHAPDVLLIPGTGSVGHLEENLAVGDVVLAPETVAATRAHPGNEEAAGRDATGRWSRHPPEGQRNTWPPTRTATRWHLS